MATVKQQCSVKNSLGSANVKCVAAKMYGLRLGFSNSYLTSHTHVFQIYSARSCRVLVLSVLAY